MKTVIRFTLYKDTGGRLSVSEGDVPIVELGTRGSVQTLFLKAEGRTYLISYNELEAAVRAIDIARRETHDN